MKKTKSKKSRRDPSESEKSESSSTESDSEKDIDKHTSKRHKVKKSKSKKKSHSHKKKQKTVTPEASDSESSSTSSSSSKSSSSASESENCPKYEERNIHTKHTKRRETLDPVKKRESSVDERNTGGGGRSHDERKRDSGEGRGSGQNQSKWESPTRGHDDHNRNYRQQNYGRDWNRNHHNNDRPQNRGRGGNNYRESYGSRHRDYDYDGNKYNRDNNHRNRGYDNRDEERGRSSNYHRDNERDRDGNRHRGEGSSRDNDWGDHRQRYDNDRQKYSNRNTSKRDKRDEERGNSRSRSFSPWQQKRNSNVNRRRKSADEDTHEWGKKDTNAEKRDDRSNIEKEKPNFGLTGKLLEDTNTVNGVVIKYSEPLEARKPKRRWRLYPFKGETALPTLHIHRQSCFLIGRDRKVCDLAVDHPSCSKQHAALQYRLVPFERTDGTAGKRVRPYVIDLESANGTFLNNKKVTAKKYYELIEKDVIKFGFSSREYVLLHENSKEDEEDDDVKQEKMEDEGIEPPRKTIKIEP